MQAETQSDFQPFALPGAYGVSIWATRGTVIPLAKIEALNGDSAATVFRRVARFARNRGIFD